MGGTPACGASNRTTMAATASVRKVSAARSMITPASTIAIIMNERCVATSAPESKSCRDNGSRCRPFCYRITARERGDQCQHCADKKEDDAGHNRHVVAGNRKNVSQ